MQILFHIKVYMQVIFYFSILVSSNIQNVWLQIYIIKYMQNVWHMNLKGFHIVENCRKCCFFIPTFNPRGVVYLPTNWPLTSPPGPLSLSVTSSSLLPLPSDSPNPGGWGREPLSTTDVKSLGWNRFSCCNFSGFWDSVAENNSFWSLNRIHTLWSYSIHVYSFYISIT